MATACGPKLLSIMNVNVWLIVGGEVVMSSRTSVLSASLTTKATLLPNQATPCGSFPTTKFEITAFVVRFRSEDVFACPRTTPGNNSVLINAATVANFIAPPCAPRGTREFDHFFGGTSIDICSRDSWRRRPLLGRFQPV